jgi:molybdate transport system ATP-binding protein
MMIVQLKSAVPRAPEAHFAAPVNWTIDAHQQWAVIGATGAGKTLVASLLQNGVALQEGAVEWGDTTNNTVRQITFKDIYSLTDCRNAYYQQRWHATETDGAPTADELLGHVPAADAEELITIFGLKELLPKRILYLSGGELRKFLIVRALCARPRILIIDNPFIGLDAASRGLLVETLQQMTTVKDLQVVLLLSDPHDIPDMITHVLPVHHKRCLAPQTRAEFLQNKALITLLFPAESSDEQIRFPATGHQPAADHAVTLRMEKVTIRYGQRTILQNIDWEVKNGERWALLGRNGSGKSTLLSLVYADNPQAYANTFYLFDRKRGSGESIWDIKRRIGFVSPEIHLYYHVHAPVWQIVGSGFFDTIGLHRSCSAAQQGVALEWMHIFRIAHLKDRLFQTLSSGEQRLALLARAFVKDPHLLILDEPLHGLDCCHKQHVTRIIEQFCTRPGKTLIYVTHYLNELPPCIDKQFDLRASTHLELYANTESKQSKITKPNAV